MLLSKQDSSRKGFALRMLLILAITNDRLLYGALPYFVKRPVRLSLSKEIVVILCNASHQT